MVSIWERERETDLVRKTNRKKEGKREKDSKKERENIEVEKQKDGH